MSQRVGLTLQLFFKRDNRTNLCL